MLLLLKFLLAHILGDFVFQPEKWVIDKEKKKAKSLKLYFHIGIHAIFLLLILQFNLQEYWLGFLVIIISHYAIDLMKLYLQNKKTKRIWFFVDQILHISVLAMVANYYHSFAIPFKSIFNQQNLLFIISLLLITNVSSIIIKLIITQWSPEKKVMILWQKLVDILEF